MATFLKHMNHDAYIKATKTWQFDSLKHVIQDCHEAIEAYPENPNCGYYWDEIHYCSMELARRAKLGIINPQ